MSNLSIPCARYGSYPYTSSIMHIQDDSPNPDTDTSLRPEEMDPRCDSLWWNLKHPITEMSLLGHDPYCTTCIQKSLICMS